MAAKTEPAEVAAALDRGQLSDVALDEVREVGVEEGFAASRSAADRFRVAAARDAV
jgi:hypothetical protein